MTVLVLLTQTITLCSGTVTRSRLRKDCLVLSYSKVENGNGERIEETTTRPKSRAVSSRVSKTTTIVTKLKNKTMTKDLYL